VVSRSGTVRASARDVCAKSIEEFQIYQKALKAADAVSAILKRPCFQRDLRLRDQLEEIERMTTGLIRHLQREDRRVRG
jgi:hypothetical protein